MEKNIGGGDLEPGRDVPDLEERLKRIKDGAQKRWERAGRPEGLDKQFWIEAEKAEKVREQGDLLLAIDKCGQKEAKMLLALRWWLCTRLNQWPEEITGDTPIPQTQEEFVLLVNVVVRLTQGEISRISMHSFAKAENLKELAERMGNLLFKTPSS